MFIEVEARPKLKCIVDISIHRRFGDLFGEDFVFYDYKYPERIPKKLEGAFDVVIADPPFLAEECLEKVAKTIEFLTQKSIILCTGKQDARVNYFSIA